MKQESVALCVIHLKDYISSKRDISVLQNKLASADDYVYEQVFMLKLINPLHVLLFGLFLGGFGVDRFMTKNYVLGTLRIIFTIAGIALFTYGIFFIFALMLASEELILNLITCLAVGSLIIFINFIWILVDICTAYPRAYNKNYKEIMKLLDRENNR